MTRSNPPYKTGENKIDGALIALLDVDRLKRRLIDTEESLRSTEERAGAQLREREPAGGDPRQPLRIRRLA